MVFSSITFLSAFLPVVLALYFLAPGVRLKNGVLLAASILFYAWGEAEWTSIVLLSILLNYIFGILVSSASTQRRAKFTLAGCVTVNLALLGYFKYFGFLATQVNPLFVLLGYAPLSITEPHLPLGISFYTFHGLTYNVDIYYRRARPQSLFNVALYKMFFPQLIAEPIVRYNIVAEALQSRTVTLEGFAGLFRKLPVALPFREVRSDPLPTPAILRRGSNRSRETRVFDPC